MSTRALRRRDVIIQLHFEEWFNFITRRVAAWKGSLRDSKACRRVPAIIYTAIRFRNCFFSAPVISAVSSFRAAVNDVHDCKTRLVSESNQAWKIWTVVAAMTRCAYFITNNNRSRRAASLESNLRQEKAARKKLRCNRKSDRYFADDAVSVQLMDREHDAKQSWQAAELSSVFCIVCLCIRWVW